MTKIIYLSVGFICCLNNPILLYAKTMASNALIPSHGMPAACAFLPKYSILKYSIAK
jgi:hypothetical protein